MSNKITFAIIIPCYYERENLEKLVPVLISLFPHTPLFIVDDHSPDGTSDFISDVHKKNTCVSVISRASKSGRGSAVLAGLKKAHEDTETAYFLEMDADFSHDPADIYRLLEKADPDTVVIGSRYVRGSRIIDWPYLRRILSRLSNLYARLFLGIPIDDYTNGFRLYPRQAVEVLIKRPPETPGYAYLSETAHLLYKNGFKFSEVPTGFVNRKIGKSNTGIGEYLKSLLAIIKIRFL